MNSTSQAIDHKLGDPEVSAEISQTSLALVAGEIHGEMNRNFLKALEEMVFPYPSDDVEHDEKSRRSAENKLQTFEGLETLKLVWKECPYVCDTALYNADMDRTFITKPMCKHSLAKEVCKKANYADPAKIHAVETDVNRIFEAAEIFGLVKRLEKQGNMVPIAGTEKLNALMKRFNSDNAAMIHSLYQENTSDPENSGECI